MILYDDFFTYLLIRNLKNLAPPTISLYLAPLKNMISDGSVKILHKFTMTDGIWPGCKMQLCNLNFSAESLFLADGINSSLKDC